MHNVENSMQTLTVVDFADASLYLASSAEVVSPFDRIMQFSVLQFAETST